MKPIKTAALVLTGALLLTGSAYLLVKHLIRKWSWDSSGLIRQLQAELREKEIAFSLTESSLDSLEKDISEALANGRITKAYIMERQQHFLALVGEVYIREYGGRWIVQKDSNGRLEYFHGIRCTNGRLASSFIAVFNDIVEDLEMPEYSYFAITAPYSMIKIECGDGEGY